MCGIAGAVSLSGDEVPALARSLHSMNNLQAHRGPDGSGVWTHPTRAVGLAHRRLSIIDLAGGAQPMNDESGNCISYNGEVYNYRELRDELGGANFRTSSDTEVILRAYRAWGVAALPKLRGMFAFALWDEARRTLVCARDGFGIKPLYYARVDGVLYVASEIKALLAFLPGIETDIDGFKDYLAFQFCLGGKTLFKGVSELPPGHVMEVTEGRVQVRRYWEVYYQPDWDHTERHFVARIQELLRDSVRLHLRSDVPVGAYVSGGVDSSFVASLAADLQPENLVGFSGRFAMGEAYDESRYARDLAREQRIPLHEITITEDDFVDHIEKIIYHLDMPVAGPGAFAQFMVSGLASQHRKVVLGGQGGDETFGGYARYLIAYFEQCIRAAIDGTMHAGNFIVTYESIIPNLVALRSYKPLLAEFWQEGLFEDLDRRYFRLINRSNDVGDEIRWEALGDYNPFETFREIFVGKNVGKESYFDRMTHFDFKTLLPALLHVEDRMSMAHGLESRVPLLDTPLVELAATIPSNIKFQHGSMKHVFKKAAADSLPRSILDRTDKMGFPVPLQEWLRARGRLSAFVGDVFSSRAALTRELVDNREVSGSLDGEPKFGRKMWGLLCLELWQRRFHDRAVEFRRGLSMENHA